MKRILAFSKNLGYAIGGAELSLVEELKKVNADIGLAYVDKPKSFSAELYPQNFPEHFSRIKIPAQFSMRKFFYIEYILNRKLIFKYIKQLSEEYDELWTQNMWGAIAVNAFSGDTVFYARDETFLCYRRNYYSGIRKTIKNMYDLFEFNAFKHFEEEQEAAVRKATRIIANSKFMASEIKKRFNRESEVVYPYVDIERLRETFHSLSGHIKQTEKGVVMVGSSIVKGVETFYKLAYCFPNVKFYLFDRSHSEVVNRGNIYFMPWVANVAEAFKYAKVVLVPSLWDEAFGRVAAEAKVLDLPCLVSSRGGLPEAVGYDEDCIAESVDDFKSKLENILLKNK